MGKKVFVSYSHQQGAWVLDRLVPCLRAGGAEVYVDVERFKPGHGVDSAAKQWQDEADLQLLVLTPSYLQSDYCKAEMERAFAKDPNFENGIVVPVHREECELPEPFRQFDAPLYVNLRDDRQARQWDLLSDVCDSDLGVDAPLWLDTRDEIRRELRRGRSIEFRVLGSPKWWELLANISSPFDPSGVVPPLSYVDMSRGVAAARPCLISHIMEVLGGTDEAPSEPHDLVALDKFFDNRDKCFLGLLRYESVKQWNYPPGLLGTLRNLISERKKLVVMFHTRAPLLELKANGDVLSSLYPLLATVELRELS